jgi:hypothetical protein
VLFIALSFSAKKSTLQEKEKLPLSLEYVVLFIKKYVLSL